MSVSVIFVTLLAVSFQNVVANSPRSRGCFPTVANIAFGRNITANSTCGDPPGVFEIPRTGKDVLEICNASDPAKSHPPRNANDNDSVSFWLAEEYVFFVTLQLNFEYSMRLESSILTFRSFRPNRMVLEKSSDFGETWQPYQYYSPTCNEILIRDGLFQGLTRKQRGGFPTNSTEAFCIEEDSAVNHPDNFGTVLFDATRFGDRRFDDVNIIDHVVVTNLRARFRDLSTLGDDSPTSPPEILRKYFYSVTEWVVQGRCFCNGHADDCVQRGGEPVFQGKVFSGCNCKHNTTGPNCEKCLPLYNNRPWRRGNSTHSNECEECDCNLHSTSCVYNETKGYGVCQNCMDNTEGDKCNECSDLYYRNSSVELRDRNACAACNCNVTGSLSLGCNASGACTCKRNVQGLKCDQCKPGFFGLQQNNLGGCQACVLCNQFGTDGGNSTCDAIDGSCKCKQNVEGKYCNRCKPGFYGFGFSNPGGCVACECSNSTAQSSNCDLITGQCQCRKGLSRRTCNESLPGQYVAFLEGPIYEAETAELHGAVPVAAQVSPVLLFTGTGYARLFAAGDRVAWWVPTPPRTVNYTTIIRYRAPSSIQVIINITGEFSAVSYMCPGSSVQFSGSSIYHVVTSLPAASDGNGVFKLDTCLLKGRRVRIEITYQPNGTAEEWFIDSLVLMPNREYVYPFTLLTEGSDLYAETAQCYVNRQSVSTYNLSTSPTCLAHTFEANAWLFNGTLACDCKDIGSESNVCQSIGGQCSCHGNITGRTCSDCIYNHFGFSTAGCQACGCSPLGSDTAKLCDPSTGQCTCKEYSTGRMCDSCIENYFNVSNCQPCTCHPNVSLSLQCSASGECQCKRGVGGLKCDGGCLPDYYQFTDDGCTPCNCDPVGSSSPRCNKSSGQCSCHSRTKGVSCDTCGDGYFDFNVNNGDVCLACFCYNHSSNCRSASGYELKEIRSNFSGGKNDDWSGTTAGGNSLGVVPYLDFTSGVIDFAIRGFIVEGFAYFNAPLKFLGNKRLSFGQTLSFQLLLQSLPDTLMPMDDGDVLIKGRSKTQPIAAALDALPGTQFRNYTIQLVESNFFWGNLSGRGVTVNEMFDVLNDIEYLRIRGGFGQNSPSNPVLDNVVLGTATLTGRSTLTNVANCSCPQGHEGLLCERCKRGYKRAVVNSTLYDSCVPCQCHGHSFACDVNTGQCLDCVHNTEGNACQLCKPGYYGNATKGTTNDCLPCPCPLTNGTNQFSPTCILRSDGQVECDSCPANNTGLRCERCAGGYFGVPNVPGSSCTRCTCSGNINLNETGNCNTTTGECLKCVNNTSGSQCDRCAYGFFGDAVSGSCQDCGCDLTGSINRSCSGITGQCPCHHGVTGRKCDQCLPKYFNFNSGSGCTPCTCDSLGSHNTTCHPDTGQCFCKPGVDPGSRTCSDCGDGFYNLSHGGCQECVCNTSNTRNGSNVCNKLSGQCPCRSGIIGLSCHYCVPGFIGAPPNCSGCGDCYSNWTLLIERLQTQVAKEDSRSSSFVRLHYGSESPEQLKDNVTTLRNFLNDVTKLQTALANVSSLNETLLRFLQQFSTFSLQLDVDQRQYDEIHQIVKQTEELWQTTTSFNGSVMVASGVYQTYDDINSLATSWNLTADHLENSSRLALNRVTQSFNAIVASNTTAYRSRLLIQNATITAERAQVKSTKASDSQPLFDTIYENNTGKIVSLTSERDRIRGGLGEYSESARNATASALQANETAGRARALAQTAHNSTKQQKTDADRMKLDAEALVQDACRTLNNTNQTKVIADATLSTAITTESSHADLNSRLNASAQSVVATKKIAAVVLALSSRPITEIQHISQQINGTIVPVAEVNDTTQQATDSKAQASDVLAKATNALNISYTAANFVSGTETMISNGTAARTTANQTIRDTRSNMSAVQAANVEVQNVTDETKSTAKQSRNVSNMADESIRMVGECRRTALSQLKGLESTTNISCHVTSVELLQNASSVLSSSNTLNASSQAQTDLSKSSELQRSAVGVQEQVTRSMLIQKISDLLEDYRRQRTVLKSKQEKLRLLDAELESLVSSIQADCAVGS